MYWKGVDTYTTAQVERALHLDVFITSGTHREKSDDAVFLIIPCSMAATGSKPPAKGMLGWSVSCRRLSTRIDSDEQPHHCLGLELMFVFCLFSLRFVLCWVLTEANVCFLTRLMRPKDRMHPALRRSS